MLQSFCNFSRTTKMHGMLRCSTVFLQPWAKQIVISSHFPPCKALHKGSPTPYLKDKQLVKVLPRKRGEASAGDAAMFLEGLLDPWEPDRIHGLTPHVLVHSSAVTHSTSVKIHLTLGPFWTSPVAKSESHVCPCKTVFSPKEKQCRFKSTFKQETIPQRNSFLYFLIYFYIEK